MRGATTNAADSPSDLALRFDAALKRLAIVPETRSAIALSGGGDSVALMRLYARWTRRHGGTPPTVLVVDHGLRKGSQKDAARAVTWAKHTGLNAHLLRWTGAKPKTNIEDRARAARYGLMGRWCKAYGVGALFVGHTRDDQAETFLLRLGRGSGVDGLSAMRPRAPFPSPGFDGIDLFRPLLSFGRDELRGFLTDQNAEWLEDPMNADSHFARVRLRGLLPAMEAAGVPLQRIADAARHQARAREALEWMTATVLKHCVRFDAAGRAILDAVALQDVPREIGLRALGAVLMQVSGETYRPRFERLEALFDALSKDSFPKARTLLGCRVAIAAGAEAQFGATIVIAREPPRRAPKPKAPPKAKQGLNASAKRKIAQERA